MSSSAIPPAPPPTPVQTTATGSAVLTVVVSSGAEALAKLPAGSLVAATLAAVESKTLIQIKTASGETLELRLPPNLALPENAELSLQTVSQGGGLALKLLAVNGRPFPFGPQLGGGLPGAGGLLLPDLQGPGIGGKAGAALGAGQGSAAAFGVPPTNALAAGAGQPQPPLGLTATVIRPAPAGSVMPPPGSPLATMQGAQAATPPPGFADLAPGTQMTVRIAGIVPPGAGAPVPPLPGQGQQGQPQSQTGSQQQQPQSQTPPSPPTGPQSAGPSGAAPAFPNSPLAPTPGGGQPATPTATVPQQSVPPGATAATASPTQPVQLSGPVVSHSPGGTAMVQTQAGLVSLPSGPNIAVGSTLQLDVVAPPVPPPPSTSAAASEGQGLGPGGWPTLSSAVDSLAQLDRQTADQLVRMIPQANVRLAAAMSIFAGAVRSGDFKLLASDGVTRGLDRAGRRDLAERLKKDFLALTEEAERPRGDGEWRAITLPFAHGAQVDPVRLYVQRVSGEDKTKGGAKGQEQRFILEVEMSRLGRLQFDGLVQKDTKRFDLIIRSAHPLGPEICRDISGIFAECAQLTGIKGAVGFQSGRAFVELPPCDAQGTRIMV
ncbi:DNA polymerase III [Paramagnetospirillum kuznetsovii]|uniref:DNA polymerase III n=1 Tax=Paramagnetospirillum kuznetsovii TaxID=2053833 RepID=A0A364P095_9PROT|nr:DNA polymerase III [Paramagnetospirillum kuznetsovii]RAU22769.1 DNA polymerase III [Paramagnetospirillum kuznetsovii]